MIEPHLLSVDDLASYRSAASDGLTTTIERDLLAHIAALEAEAAELSAELDHAHQAGAALVVERDRLQAAAVETTERLIETHEQDVAEACATVAAFAAREMPQETSASIAAWQNETFGPATTTWERVDRSDELMRGAMWMAKSADLTVLRPNLSRAIRAAEELAELIELLVERDDDPRAGKDVADVQIILAGIPAALGQEDAWPWDPSRPVAGQYEEWVCAAEAEADTPSRHLDGWTGDDREVTARPSIASLISADDDVEPTDPATKFGELAQQISVPVDRCTDCSTSDGCAVHRMFTCEMCEAMVTWDEGADDDGPDVCSYCWALIEDANQQAAHDGYVGFFGIVELTVGACEEDVISEIAYAPPGSVP